MQRREEETQVRRSREQGGSKSQRTKHEDVRGGQGGRIRTTAPVTTETKLSFTTKLYFQENFWSMKGVEIVTKLITSHN